MSTMVYGFTFFGTLTVVSTQGSRRSCYTRLIRLVRWCAEPVSDALQRARLTRGYIPGGPARAGYSAA